MISRTARLLGSLILAIAMLGLAALVLSGPALATSQDDNSTAIVTPQTTVSSAGATNSTDQTNYSWSGVLLTVDITTITGTAPTLTVKVQEKDPASGKYADLPNCTTTALNSVATTVLVCYPGITVAANSTVSISLPKQWRVVQTAGGTPTNITWTVGAQYLK